MYGWDIFGTVTFNDVNCSGNVAANDGGCFYGAGSNIFNDGVFMLDNEAEKGGCICECNMHRFGFLCTGRGTAATVLLFFSGAEFGGCKRHEYSIQYLWSTGVDLDEPRLLARGKLAPPSFSPGMDTSLMHARLDIVAPM